MTRPYCLPSNPVMTSTRLMAPQVAIDPAKTRERFLKRLKEKATPKKPGRTVKFVTVDMSIGPDWIYIRLPIRTANDKNNHHDHWAQRSKRTAEQRTSVCRVLDQFGKPWGSRWKVTLTRFAPRALDVGDNLPRALSAVRDGVADWLCIDDADPRIEWVYEQVRGPAYGISVRVWNDGK